MFEFVYWLKTLAVLLITNSHYAGIWPVSAMAVGGHLGNNLFFLLSGFCLCNISGCFGKWYIKRILRIYPALWIANTTNMIVGFFHADGLMAYVHCYIYPTWYHFVASIMILYIIFYLIRTIQKKAGISTTWIILATFVIFISVYIIKFDKSYYHIDDVSEKWVRFMFFESMLVGAYLRESYERFNQKVSIREIVTCIVCLGGHLASKLVFRRIPAASALQVLSPILVILCVGNIALLFIKMDKRGFWKQFDNRIRRLVQFISMLSLEVYLCQNVIIDRFDDLLFPINFVICSGLIIVNAWIIHLIADNVYKFGKKQLNL